MITFAPSRRTTFSPGGGGHAPIRFNPSHDETGPQLLSPWELSASEELDPLVVLAFGRRGDGKTLWMTTTLSIMLQQYIRHKRRPTRRHPDGFKIATNYHVQFSDFNNPMVVDMISSYDQRMRRLCAGIDEILSYVPSRRSSARVNVDWANALVQIRKLDMEIVSTTQFPQNLDSQMLQQIDLFVVPILYNRQWIPQRELWTHKMTGKMEYKPTSIRFMVWDWWGHFTGKQWSKRWPPQMSGEPPDDVKDYHNVHELFSWFSTKEQIPSIWHRNREDVIIREWEQELTEMAEEYAPDVIEEEEETARGHQNIATLADLIAAQPDDVLVNTLLEEAQRLDKSVKTSRQLASRMEEAGYTMIRESRYGWRAIRLEQ